MFAVDWHRVSKEENFDLSRTISISSENAKGDSMKI